MRALAGQLEEAAKGRPKAGPLKGLLFNDPERFLTDLVCMLRLKAAFADYVAASASGRGVKGALRSFTDELTVWYKRTGYQNVWDWPKLTESLGRLGSPRIDRLIEQDIRKNLATEDGATPFEKIANSMKRSETFNPDLIQALNEECK
jgi:hypothetical protein